MEMDQILDVGGFNLDRALEMDPKFLEPEYPFEWAGVYRLDRGTYRMGDAGGARPGDGGRVSAAGRGDRRGRDAATMDAVLAFSDEASDVAPGGELAPGKQLANLRLDGPVTRFELRIERPGAYALFTEHHPDEFHAWLEGPSGEIVTPMLTHEYKPDHEHDEEVSSVGIDLPGDLNEKKLNRWMGELLQTKGTDIFRMKGS